MQREAGGTVEHLYYLQGLLLVKVGKSHGEPNKLACGKTEAEKENHKRRRLCLIRLEILSVVF